MKKLFLPLIAILVCISVMQVWGQNLATIKKKPAMRAQAPEDIVKTLTNNAGFVSLTKAIKVADFIGALSQAGPFTIFAPTDEAFSQITAFPEWLQPDNKEKLASILKYHVVQGKLMASELRDGQTIPTLNGEELTVSVLNGKVLINGAEITQPNMMAANGVIHVVNRVVFPGANLGNK
ncbi:fasciclin domain-containing protein [Cytophagaceae bacterium DM2B3-1]|uniref:Fasciclin domain-containing protein n=1 Tax=Xanthocytophaga flava TaxID=3048013 RepID=A0ABT7CFA4_9BACT|nr:fasciclin domain-containing protein [Xanthocytophaga flavus]MDJ1470027.1 fasciclin domain-containing protein [Xanthocytophaga flavus]MDJ1491409.1 fasciclin domain-containing protein [Xanthocytophaga flavus]